jgi:hypothetical protein
MPGRDGTGPNGLGPMTGRKLGPCNKDQQAQPIQFGRGMGCRRGCGQGFGFRNNQNNEQTKDQ